MMQRRSLRLAWVAALWWVFSLQPSHACTLWGAAGSAVDGGGVLITKNRDWAPDQGFRKSSWTGAKIFAILPHGRLRPAAIRPRQLLLA